MMFLKNTGYSCGIGFDSAGHGSNCNCAEVSIYHIRRNNKSRSRFVNLTTPDSYRDWFKIYQPHFKSP